MASCPWTSTLPGQTRSSTRRSAELDRACHAATLQAIASGGVPCRRRSPARSADSAPPAYQGRGLLRFDEVLRWLPWSRKSLPPAPREGEGLGAFWGRY